MRPLTRPYTDPAGGQWFWTSGRFPTEALGSAAYRFVYDTMPVGDLGIYRHGEPGEGGVLVSAVSLKRADVLKVARLLANRGGRDEQLDQRIVGDLCVRRARVVVEASEVSTKAGRIRIRHAGAGARLNPDGSMDEPIGEG